MFSALEHSIIKRAVDSGHISINYIDFRNYTTNKHRRVDDTPYGGGAGMVISAQPVVDCIEAIDPEHKAHRIFLTPSAKVLTQKRVCELAKYERLILLCGHYEGVDQRAIDLCIDECISIGEYVLTGGEIPAMILVDCVSRYVDGVIKPESLLTESFSKSPVTPCHPLYERGNNSCCWEHPQYTRPRDFRGLTVPEVLLSGNHAEIERWRNEN